MRSLHMLICLIALGACTTPQVPKKAWPATVPQMTQPETDDALDPTSSGPVGLSSEEAALPYGEETSRTIGRIIPADEAKYRAPEAVNIKLATPDLVLEPDVARALEKVAASLPEGYGTYLAAGYRTLDEQFALVRQNCENPPGYKSCRPKIGRPETCMPIQQYRNSCPHTTGRAVDAWAVNMVDGQWVQAISQRECLMGHYGMSESLEACASHEAQAILIQTMKANGFCVHKKQPWHFENPKLTRACYF